MYLVSPDVSEKALDKNKEEGLNLPSGTCPSYPVLQTSATDMARQIYYERENTKSRLSLTISRAKRNERRAKRHGGGRKTAHLQLTDV